MTHPIVARHSERGRMNAPVLDLRRHQRRRADQDQRRRQLLEHTPEQRAAALLRRARRLADAIDATLAERTS